MVNQIYVLHDICNNTKVVCRGYDAYLEYYQQELKPAGLGTRYMFSEVTRAKQFYHFRLCTESGNKQ